MMQPGMGLFFFIKKSRCLNFTKILYFYELYDMIILSIAVYNTYSNNQQNRKFNLDTENGELPNGSITRAV